METLISNLFLEGVEPIWQDEQVLKPVVIDFGVGVREKFKLRNGELS